MDCLFNKNIPEARDKEIIFKPLTKTFINGLASSYDFIYDNNILGKYMKESQFQFLTTSLNEELISHWPCTMCIVFGYLCSPCTLGLSFLCPYTCISTSKDMFLEKLGYFNTQYFNTKNLNLTYHQNCCTSWIKLEVVDEKRLSTINNEVLEGKRKQKEKETVFGSQTEVLLNTVDTKMKLELKY